MYLTKCYYNRGCVYWRGTTYYTNFKRHVDDNVAVTFQDDLWGNAIFLKEANAISVELKKKVQYLQNIVQIVWY